MENIMTFLILFLVYEIIKYIKAPVGASSEQTAPAEYNPLCPTDFGGISYKVKK